MGETAEVQARPYRMHNRIQHYAWGTRGESAFIPRLLGIAPEPDTPYAELWMGAHPKAPSEIELPDGTRVPLDAWIARHPAATLGDEVQARYGQLPFLFKVLSAGQALSIQAHPTREQAGTLHARAPEHYPDDNHKPEIAVALDELAALVGFRPFPDLVATLRRYPELARFAGPAAADPILGADGPSPQRQQELTYALFAALVQRAIDEPPALEEAVDRMADALSRQGAAPRGASEERERRFLALREQYGSGDVGLFALFLFNLVHLKPGEAIYTEAGVPHAYLEGNILECMANSDNVVRVGLTPKFKDAETLLQIVDPTPRAPRILDGDPETVEPGVGGARYTTPAPEFEIRRWQFDAGTRADVDKGDGPAILLVVEGEVEVAWGDAASEREIYRRGDTAFLPARLTALCLHAGDAAEVVQADVPGI